jgi:glycosyltransferase involved in cell wall biosynthesis
MQGKENQQPLISIIVITYNSAKYVLETLESIKAQTYQNIELIVTDDCSTDNTIELCQSWISKNQSRFIKTKIVTAKRNNGIPANCNSGIKASIGEWVKIIAGDDLLHQDCLKHNMDFVSKNKDAKVIFSKRVVFTGSSANMKVVSVSKPSLFNEKNVSSEQQYELALRRVSCPPNTILYNKKVLKEVNGFDEEFPLYEDWPMLLKVTKHGYKFHYMDEETFFYRIHQDSVYNYGTERYIYKDWDLKSWIPVYIKYILPNITFSEKLNFYYLYSIMHFFYYTPLNKRNIITRILQKFLLTPVNIHKKLILHYLFKRISNQSIRKMNSKSPLQAHG